MEGAPQLGDRVHEIVTGIEGVVTGMSEFLWGCRQALVHYTDTEGKPQSEWFDLGRLDVVERGAISPVVHEESFVGGETPPPAIA